MNESQLKSLLQQVRSGRVSADEAVGRLRDLPFEDLGFAKLDHHRALRAGMAEVVLGEGKTPAQVAAIFTRLAARGNNVLVTRANPAQFRAVNSAERHAGGAKSSKGKACRKAAPRATFHDIARCIVLRQDATVHGKGEIAVVSAGTSDMPVAEEAAITAEVMGNSVARIYDVGVAGIHRLLAHRSALVQARVVIVCAGMEGALPSVVGGLLRVPVIAVPTSVGYGSAFGGIAALLGMLNSCASNVTAVNIDNGFGAGYVASIINRL